MRKQLASIAIAGVVASMLTPSGDAVAAPEKDLSKGIRRQFAAGIQVVPKQVPGAKAAPRTANPLIALLPDPTKVDKSYWNRVAATKSAQRAAQRDGMTALVAPALLHDELEPAGVLGSNDSPAEAELIAGFGTGTGKNNRVRILGQTSPERVGVTPVERSVEDDGSIPLAANNDLGTSVTGIQTDGQIGDGPHGSAGTGSGDFDFLKVTAAAGQQVIADIDTPNGSLDTVLGLYDSTGAQVEVNDDDGVTFDSLLRFQVAESGTYYLMVSGFGLGTVFPEDPFDSASGYGVGEEGDYSVTVTVGLPDLDFFAVNVAAGDVIGASVKGTGTRLVVRDPAGGEVIGSDQDASSVYAPNAPLPGGGNAVVSHVAARPGRYSVEVVGTTGGYDVTLEAYRPGPESTQRGTVQTLFLDFDGQRVNTTIWGGPGVRDLSPLAGFLGRWGLTGADEAAVIRATIAAVRENVAADLRARGTNPNFGLRIVSSRDGTDPFGQANVHRVIVGGTMEESGIETIGIAQFIDPGNYGTEDSAVVLLDALSDPTGAASLNTYLKPTSDKIAFIGRALANVIAHEAGHLYGNFHTDSKNDSLNLMDAGGTFPGMFGVGPDGIGGTADDVDNDFGADTLYPNEGFTGTEDTLNTSAWGLSKGKLK